MIHRGKTAVRPSKTTEVNSKSKSRSKTQRQTQTGRTQKKNTERRTQNAESRLEAKGSTRLWSGSCTTISLALSIPVSDSSVVLFIIEFQFVFFFPFGSMFILAVLRLVSTIRGLLQDLVSLQFGSKIEDLFCNGGPYQCACRGLSLHKAAILTIEELLPLRGLLFLLDVGLMLVLPSPDSEIKHIPFMFHFLI